jgi:hypothetical protein
MEANRILFAPLNNCYTEDKFPGTLVFIPRKDRDGSIPCNWHPTPHRKIMIYYHGVGEDLSES